MSGRGWYHGVCWNREQKSYAGTYLYAGNNIRCGDTGAFDGHSVEHMIALVEGGMEYLNTIATMYDKATQKRMVKQFKEVQQELKVRLVREASHTHHHGQGLYHTHGHGMDASIWWKDLLLFEHGSLKSSERIKQKK